MKARYISVTDLNALIFAVSVQPSDLGTKHTQSLREGRA